MTTTDRGSRRGVFVSLEGGEGVGKSTQLAALADAIRARGQEVVTTREPGGSVGAEAIRTLLLHSDADAWNPAAEALLFAAARSDHVARVIRPALDRGAWVLCDRYIDSSRAYQGGASGMGDADLLTLHRIGSGGLLPDRTLLLTLPADQTAQRRAARTLAQPDRFETRLDDFHSAVVSSFARMAHAEPGRIRIIAAEGDPAAVTARLLDALADLL